jgi:hypothetical protein
MVNDMLRRFIALVLFITVFVIGTLLNVIWWGISYVVRGGDPTEEELWVVQLMKWGNKP